MMTMPLDQVLQWINIGMTAVMILGGAFTAGRLFERMANVRRGMAALKKQQKEDMTELKDQLFGPHGQGGIFLPRAEWLIQRENDIRERGEFDNRLTEISRRVGGVETRVASGPEG